MAVSKKVIIKNPSSPRKTAVKKSYKESKSDKAIRESANATQAASGGIAAYRLARDANRIRKGANIAMTAARAARGLGVLGGVSYAAEAIRLSQTRQGRREYMDMRRAIDMGMRGKDVKGRDLIRKGTIYTTVAEDVAKKAAAKKVAAKKTAAKKSVKKGKK